MDRDKVNDLLVADDYQLLGILYQEITGQRAPDDVARTKPGHGYIYYDLTVRLFAALWVAEQREHLQTLICKQWDFCKRRNDPTLADRVQLCSAVADVIAAGTLGVPPFSIAVLLVRLGLAAFCGCDTDAKLEDPLTTLVAKWVAKASGTAAGHKDYYDRDWYRAYEWIGDRFFDADRHAKALEYFLKALDAGAARSLNDGRLANQIAWCLYELGRPAEAVPHAERAVAIVPDDAVLDTLGVVYFAAGDFKRSIEALERSIVVGSATGPAWTVSEEADENRFHLVRSYMAAGMKSEALRVVGQMRAHSGIRKWRKLAEELLS